MCECVCVRVHACVCECANHVILCNTLSGLHDSMSLLVQNLLLSVYSCRCCYVTLQFSLGMGLFFISLCLIVPYMYPHILTSSCILTSLCLICILISLFLMFFSCTLPFPPFASHHQSSARCRVADVKSESKSKSKLLRVQLTTSSKQLIWKCWSRAGR
jgi:hypothetical protein